MRKILIIEDNELVLEVISELILTKFEIKPKKAISVPSALGILGLEKFDLVVCDYEIGSLKGDVVLNFLRNNSMNTPIIFFTGRADLKIPIMFPLYEIVDDKCLNRLMKTIERLLV